MLNDGYFYESRIQIVLDCSAFFFVVIFVCFI